MTNLTSEEQQNPSVGRIVHYVMDVGHAVTLHSQGAHRPAIVVHVWNQETYMDGGTVQLQVFTDSSNDGHTSGTIWRTSVHQDEETKAPGTWHWPERVTSDHQV